MNQQGLRLAIVYAVVAIAAQLVMLVALPPFLPPDGPATDALDRVISTAYEPFLRVVSWITPPEDHTIGNIWLVIFAFFIGVLSYALMLGVVGYIVARSRTIHYPPAD
jgi:hypothetical protein